jgi:hypothetical protein
VKAPAILALASYLLVDLRTSGRRLAGGLAVVLATWAGTALLVPDPFGWVAGLRTPGEGRTFDAPSNMLAAVLTSALQQAGWAADFTALLTACRVAAAVVALAVVAWLLMTCDRRSAEMTAGLALLTCAALGPVFYAWYLAGPIFLLAPALRGSAVRAAIGVCAAASLTSLPSLGHAGARVCAVFATAGCALVFATLATAHRGQPESAASP